jgi:preprotein translocase subunit SecF
MAKPNQQNTQQNQDSKKWGRYDFLGPSKYLAVISIVLTFASFILVAVNGLYYGVDFAGGIEAQVKFSRDVDAGKVRQMMTDIGYGNANVQAIGGTSEYLLRVEMVQGKTDAETNKYITDTVEKMRAGVTKSFAEDNPEIRRVDTVGPQVGAELRRNGILAGFYCLLLILIYIGLRFDYRFAPAAVFCVIHDAIFTVAIYSILGWEVTTQTMAAVLTIIGYSLNDTIVIFDRIRETQGEHRRESMYNISNLALNQTLSRTILTFTTTFMTVASMYIFADGVIQDFARTMMIGMILGVYSTVYVATPIVLAIDKLQEQRKKQVQAAA